MSNAMYRIACAGFLICGVTAAPSLGSTFSENFDGFDAGTEAANLIHNQDANWVPISGAAWHVRDTTGYEGSNYLRQTNAGAYARNLEGSEILTLSDTNDTFEAKMVLASTSEVRFSNSWLFVGKDDENGQAGVGLRFNNGGTAQTTTNGVVPASSFAPMTSGDVWNNASLGAAYRDGNDELIRWKRDVWYTIQFADLLSGSPTLTIFETGNPSNFLVNGVDIPIGSFGEGTTLDEINLVGVRASAGDQRGQKYDDMVFVPEPTALGLVGLGGLMLRRRRSA